MENRSRYASAQAARKPSASAGFHQRPDAAAEACAKRRGSRGAEPAGRGSQEHRLRHLIAQQFLGGLLRPIDQPAEGPQSRRRPDASPASGMILPLSMMKCSSRQPATARSNCAGVGRLQQRLQPLGGIRRAAQRGRQVRRRGRSLPPQISASGRGQPEAELYFSRRRPVFSAATPLAPTANTWPGGTGMIFSNSTGHRRIG